MDVAAWLHGLGLGQYERAFRDNAVDDAVVLRELTEADLEKLGVLLGHRKRILKAVAAHGDAAATEAGPPVGAAAAERRHLTVLFCDLAGSTALSARLDPEDLSEVMADYRRVVADAVRKKGGYVAKFLGDGVLAYFGWPGAHEDDAERAVRGRPGRVRGRRGPGDDRGPARCARRDRHRVRRGRRPARRGRGARACRGRARRRTSRRGCRRWLAEARSSWMRPRAGSPARCSHARSSAMWP